MPTSKLTMLFQQPTNVSSPNNPQKRIAGWSESWYFNDTVANTILAAQGFTLPGASSPPTSILALRAALLSKGGSINAIRVQAVSPIGQSQVLAVSYPGDSTQQTDFPSNGLLVTAPGTGVSNIRRFIIRGIPDAMVVEGEFAPTPGFSAALMAFFSGLGIWQMRGRDLSQQVFPLINIAASVPATGLSLCQTIAATNPYVVGNVVRILRSRDATGNLRGGRFPVATIGPLSSQFSIFGWPFGACTGGSVRLEAPAIFSLVNPALTKVSRVVTRRVGRPFTQFRGRRSRRR